MPRKKGAPRTRSLRVRPIQRLFAREYVKDYDTAAAAARAGREGTGRQLTQWAWLQLQNAWVIREVARLEAKMDQALVVTKQKVLDDLEAERVGAMGGGQWAAAVRATELMGKHLGMFAEKVLHEGRGVVFMIADKPALGEIGAGEGALALGDGETIEAEVVERENGGEGDAAGE